MISKRLKKVFEELSEEGLIDLRENESIEDWLRRLSLSARDNLVQEWVDKHRIQSSEKQAKK